MRDWHHSSIVPTSVTRAARLTGTRSAFALRLTRIRLCNGGSSRIESGSAFTRAPGLSSGRTELLASGKTTGWPIKRSKSWPVIVISSPSWASRGTTQSQGLSAAAVSRPT